MLFSALPRKNEEVQNSLICDEIVQNNFNRIFIKFDVFVSDSQVSEEVLEMFIQG